MKYQLSKWADRDLDKLTESSIREFGLGQTQIHLGGLDYLFELLAENPKMGTRWRGDTRRHPYKRHIVYYRVRKNDILILRIRSALMKPTEQ